MNPVQIQCPHCRAMINLPPQLEVLHQVKKGGGGFVAFGDPDKMLPCPHCGRGIHTGEIIDGKHDPKTSWVDAAATLAVLALIGFGLLFFCSRR